MDLFRGEGAKRENAEQYQELLVRLTNDYRPVGAAESLEVERITACWWKLGRAWRYENSEIAYEQSGVDSRLQELLSPGAHGSDPPLSPEHVTLKLLRTAAAEIESTKKISYRLKEEMAGAVPRFKEVWAVVEKTTDKQLADFAAQVSVENQLAPTDPDSATMFLLHNIQVAIYIIEHRIRDLVESLGMGPYDNTAVPKAEVLDRLVRAEAGAERNLGRAIDRLERLQRRRLGEAVPPPVSVRLTR
jgi:hypothetical protein